MNLAAVMSLNTAGFVNPLNSARSAFGGFAGALQSLGNLGNVFTGLQSAIGLARGAIAPLGDAIRGAADFESLNAEFSVMLGNADRAAALIGQIKGFASTTPFETEGLAQNAKTLLAFGTAGDAILPTLKMLGDVAGGSQEKLGQLTLAFAQISSAGKLQGQDLLQLINAGFNPLQEISRTTGQSMATLREEMEKGGVSAQMVEGAFQSATSAGGRFFGNTAAQGRTFNGLFSTLKDTIADLYRSFGQPVMMALKPVLEQASALASALMPIAESLGQKFSEVVSTISTVALTLGKALVVGFQSGQITDILSQALSAAASIFLGALGTGFSSVISIVGIALKGAFQSAVALLSDSNFWAGIGHQVQAIAFALKSTLLNLVATVIDVLPPALKVGGKADAAREGAKAADLQSEAHALTGKALMEEVDFEQVMEPMFSAAEEAGAKIQSSLKELADDIGNNPQIAELRSRIKALADSFGQPASGSSGGNTAELLQQQLDEIQRLRAAAANGTGEFAAKGDATGKDAAAATSPKNVDALTRVGGLLASYSPQLAEQKRQSGLVAKTNEILTSVLAKIGGGTNTAVWA